MRIALATNYMPPYRIPLYAALNETSGWELKVFCSCEMEFDRQWDFTDKFSFACKNSFSLSYKRRVGGGGGLNFLKEKQVHLPFGLLFDLCRYRPDVVISTEFGARSLIAATYCFLLHKPFLIWSYSTPHVSRNISWKQRILRMILPKMANAAIGMGSEAREDLKKYGISDDALFDAKNAVENSQFLSEHPREGRLDIRREFEISGFCYLYVGSLIHRKGVDYLLDGWEAFSKEIGKDVSLVLVGDGKLRESLIRRAASMEFDNVKFLGFIPPEKLPEIYKACDIFVFPTLEDVWGLVVNEAMASGLPVICSKYAGCAPDLIVENQNGWIVDPIDRSTLVETFLKAWEARGERELLGKCSQKIIGKVSIQAMAEGFRRAVRHVLPE